MGYSLQRPRAPSCEPPFRPSQINQRFNGLLTSTPTRTMQTPWLQSLIFKQRFNGLLTSTPTRTRTTALLTKGDLRCHRFNGLLTSTPTRTRWDDVIIG